MYEIPKFVYSQYLQLWLGCHKKIVIEHKIVMVVGNTFENEGGTKPMTYIDGKGKGKK